MAYDNKNYDEKRNLESVYSKRVKAGKRRTYFFDVKETRGSDYFITITESKKRFNDDGYDRHKMFIYKEDFNKFLNALTETVDHVKTELMPDFDFDAFNHEYPEDGMNEDGTPIDAAYTPSTSSVSSDAYSNNNNNAINDDDMAVDKW